MCDNKSNNNLNAGVSFAAGAFIGALIGAAAVVLLNPTTGPENRKKLGTAAKKYSEKGEELIDEAVQQADKVKRASEPYVRTATEKITPLVHSVSQTVSDMKAPKQEQIDHLVEEVFDDEQEDLDLKEEQSPKKKNAPKDKRYFKKTS